MLSEQFLEKQKNALLKEKIRLEEEIVKLKKYPDDDGLEDDRVQELSDYETNLSIDAQLELLLKKVKSALRAIEAGKYGVCKVCGAQIEEKRLVAMPYTDLCVTCRKKNGSS